VGAKAAVISNPLISISPINQAFSHLINPFTYPLLRQQLHPNVKITQDNASPTLP